MAGFWSGRPYYNGAPLAGSNKYTKKVSDVVDVPSPTESCKVLGSVRFAPPPDHRNIFDAENSAVRRYGHD
jgi:hypothetical protein